MSAVLIKCPSAAEMHLQVMFRHPQVFQQHPDDLQVLTRPPHLLLTPPLHYLLRTIILNCTMSLMVVFRQLLFIFHRMPGHERYLQRG
jgi:hypothetical protein